MIRNFYLASISRLFRKLPVQFRGKTRLLRFLAKPFFSDDEYLIETNPFKIIVPNLKEPIAFSIFSDGVYESETISLIRKELNLGDVFVDVGANIGFFSMQASRIVGETGRVLGIEASPKVFSFFKKNIKKNKLHNVIAQNCLLMDRDDVDVPFYEAPDSSFGMGSIGPQFKAAERSYKSISLDSLLKKSTINKVNVIKADIEGAEVLAFKGARELLMEQSPVIVFEFSSRAEERIEDIFPGDSQVFLRDLGYSIWLLKDYLNSEEPLKDVLTEGFEMLVAKKV